MAVKMFEEKDDLFLESCKLAQVKPTMRQRKKWKRGEGLARTKIQEAKQNLNPDNVQGLGELS